MSMVKPSPAMLAQAHAAADLHGSLAEAMRSPVLARCLEITALALAHPRAGEVRPPPAAPPLRLSAARSPYTKLPRDYKRASAADTEE
ncbi:hypothetical protein FOC84_21125 [Achromobacter pestifer]|uniref:Uncharacterized protein n=1 Tax=Achromobacter pestifer TaxID=1353889 RepID=A0A7D4IA82_9BURK|nr:hypothetical protein [Achromobacter pestifer]QKH37302.1 hypothetical protein FOC84_21125 [Achromobacter pestifer]